MSTYKQEIIVLVLGFALIMFGLIAGLTQYYLNWADRQTGAILLGIYLISWLIWGCFSPDYIRR